MIIKPQLQLAIAALCLSMSPLALAEWSADFQPPTIEKPVLRIDLPNDLDISVLTTLIVELDGIDITSLIEFQDQDFLYTPVQPLKNGEHLLRLMVLNADGSLTEKAKWQFNSAIAHSDLNEQQQEIANAEAWLKSSSFQADTLTEFSHRFKQRNLNATPDHSIISGSGNVQGTLRGERLSVNGRSNYFIQSDKDLSLTGNEADIGEYDVAVKYAGDSMTTGLTLGHHDVGLDSLLFSPYQRRGLSAQIQDNNNRANLNLFALHPEAIAGTNNFTGLNDSDNRLEGASVSFKPFSNGSDALKVTGLYYDGKGNTGGIGISGGEDVSTGSGYGVIVEKSFAQGKLDVKAEYARSHFDVDGEAGLAPEDKSDAMSLLVEARPFDNPIFFDKQMDIVVGTRYERIDTFFGSLANQNIAADRDAVSIYSNIYWGNLSASLQLGRETNNVDDLSTIPTDRLRNFLWSANYSFDPQTGKSAWLGTPYLSFSGAVSTLDRQDTPTAYLGNDTDNTSNSLTLGGGSSYEEWYWYASHTFITFNDDANTTSDTTNDLTSLGLGWTVSERLTLNGDFQFGSFEDKGSIFTNSTNSYDTNLNLGLRSILIENKLDFSVNYNLNLASGSNDSPDRHIVNSELGWTFKQASTNNPGYAFAVRGSMEKTNEKTNSINDGTQYQLFAVFHIMASLSTGI